MIDVSEHIDLLGSVIRKMNIPPYLADEAFSEGLVALTKAAQKFREEEGVPVEAWLRKYIQWELLNWQHQEYRHNSSEVQEWDESPIIPVELNVQQRLLLKEIILAVDQLEPAEKMAMMGNYYGLNFAQVCEEVKRITGFGHPNVVQFLAAQARTKVANILSIRKVATGKPDMPVTKSEGETTMAIAGKSKTTEKAAPAKAGPKTRARGAAATAVAEPETKKAPAPKAEKKQTPQAERAHEKAEDTLCTSMQKDNVTRCKMPKLKGLETCYNHTSNEKLVEMGHKPKTR